jgi:hypothetical protein
MLLLLFSNNHATSLVFPLFSYLEKKLGIWSTRRAG